MAGVLLALGLASQVAWVRHLDAASPLPQLAPTKPLRELPLELGEWRGVDVSIDPKLLYGEQHLQRDYQNVATRQLASLWIVYAADGEDRAHYPEVCMASAGSPEDKSVRQPLSVPGRGGPIQQYRFQTAGQSQWVFYWHYMLLPAPDATLSSFQRLAQLGRGRPAGLTIEVFAPARTASDLDGAREFTRLVDEAIQPHLSPRAIRGSRRLPLIVDDDVLRALRKLEVKPEPSTRRQ